LRREETEVMTFTESIRTVLSKYAEFEGRATRPEFWWWALFSFLVSSALGVFNVIPVGAPTEYGAVASVGSILSGLWGIAVLLPGLAVTVRRLRDAGYGWANVFWILLPIAGLIVLIVYLTKPSTYAAPSAPAAPPAVPPAAE
jgi:uncharacterized membrane protein YhaH (DUF805 family)